MITPVHTAIQEALDDQTSTIPPDIDALTTQLTNTIHTALDQSVGRRSPRPAHVNWFWNDELEDAFRTRELCYRAHRHAIGVQKGVWAIRHQAATKKFRALIQSRKRATWRDFCNKLATGEFSTATATIKRMRQNRTANPTFTDMAGPETAAARMVDQLSRTFSGNALPRLRPNAPPRPLGPHAVDDDCPLTAVAVKTALKTVARRKAPGVDHIRAEMFTPIVDVLTDPLTDLFRLCWKWSKTPKQWSMAQVCPIYKKGDVTDPANYRPISLLSVLRKVLEICLHDSLHQASPEIDVVQGGFRFRRSALDQALCLHELSLRHRFDYKRSPVLVFLDAKSAYDVVDRNVIWRALEPYASAPLLGILQSMFDDVSIQVLLSGITSRSFTPRTGVLQGSILSPHLYSIFINSLPSFLRSLHSDSSSSSSDFQPSSLQRHVPRRLVSGKWINSLLYADDVVLLGDRSNIQQILNRAEAHSHLMGYRWNPSKCVVLQQPNTTSPLPPLFLYDQPLTTAPSFNYLGIPFSASGLISTAQLIQRNTASALAGMRTLRMLGCNPHSFPRLFATRIYKQFIRPRFEYGLAISIFLKKDLVQLEKGQDQCLRYIFGGHKTASTKVFRHMANLPTMTERAQTLGAKYLLRAYDLPADALLTLLRPRLHSQRHQWHKLHHHNLIWKLLPPPPESSQTTALREAIRIFRLNNLLSLQRGEKAGVLIAACRPDLGIDPILFLPMSARERSRLLRWRMGWLPGKPIPCTHCHSDRTSRHHLLACLSVADELDVDMDCEPNPIDYLLNQLPRHRPRDRATITYWNYHWPRLMVIMEQIDRICFVPPPSSSSTLEEDSPPPSIPDDPDLGLQFLEWLDPPRRLPHGSVEDLSDPTPSS